MLYKFSVNELPQGILCLSTTGSSLGSVRRVSYVESLTRLTRDDSFQGFFRLFASEFIPAQCNRRAQPISQQGLRELFAMSELFITEKCSEMTDNELNPRVVGVATKQNELQAVSYSSSLPVECGLGVHTYLYGFDVELLIRHVRGHLSHIANIWEAEGVVAMTILVPICIDLNSLERRLHETIGDTFSEPQERHLRTVLGAAMPYFPSISPMTSKL